MVTIFFVQEFKIFYNYKHGDQIESIKFHGYVFFTPWETTELWDIDDYFTIGRVWKQEGPYTDTSRVFIAKNDVPVSNYSVHDSITEAWEENYEVVGMPGLPFSIKQKAIHPDTIQWYADHYGDDSVYHELDSEFYDPMSVTIIPTFTGTVTGRLMTWFVNDLGNTVNMPLTGVLVKLRERDFHVSQTFGETHTNEFGDFVISYNERQMWEGGELELWLEFKSENKNHNFKVCRPNLDFMDITILAASESFEFRKDDTRKVGENAGLIEFNDIVCNDHAHWATHWTSNAFRYTDAQGVGVDGTGLRIILNAGGNFFRANAFLGSQNFWVAGTLGVGAALRTRAAIRLTDRNDEHENTLYHEWGHFYMWMLQKKNMALVVGYNHNDAGAPYPVHTECKNLSSHSYRNQEHTRIAWSEGWANAIQFILDAVYWEQDGEYGWERQYFNNGTHDEDEFNGHEIRSDEFEIAFVDIFGDVVRQTLLKEINDGYRSEYYFACALYDMWDGANRGLPTTLSNEPNIHPFNDRQANNLGGNWPVPDDVELSFADLVKPLQIHDGASNKIHNIKEYVESLMTEVFHNNCEARRDIAKCLYHNRVVLNIEDVDNNGENTNTMMSSDEIYEFVTLTDDGREVVLCTKISDVLHYKRKYLEDVANKTFNLNGGPSEITNKSISDNLRLGYNFLNPVDRTVFNFNTTHNDRNLTMGTCGDVRISINNNAFNIGNGTNTSVLKIQNQATLVLDEMSVLTINNGSSLIIEPGGTLIIHPGAQNILNGPNAVLHIKGRIFLEQNADFNPIAGANGYGKVIFDNSSNGFIIDARRTNRIIIDPITKPTNLSQFNLVVIGKPVVTTENPPGISLNKPISLFEILNANVLITDQSSLESRTRNTNINNSLIMGEVNKNSIGIIASTSLVTINQTRFEWLNTGFENKLKNIEGKRNDITNSQFIKCKTGIKMNSGFVKVENCLFNCWGRSEGYGIRSYSSSSGDVLIDNTFQMPASHRTQHNSKSFDYFGKNARVFRNVFVDNNIAINNREGEMFIECNNFQSWTFRELSYVAISSKNGTLYLNTGRNLFAHYQTYLNTDNSIMQINKGENLFKLGEINLSQLYFNCKINNNQLLELKTSIDVTDLGARQNILAFDFSFNYWKESSAPNPTDFKPIPANNFNINIQNHNGTSYDLGYLQLPPNNVSNYLNFQNTFCSTRYDDIDEPLKDIEDIEIFDKFSTEYSIPNSDPNKPSSIVSTNYIEVVLSTFEKANLVTVNYEEVLPEIIYIAQINLPDTSKNVASYIYNLSHHIFNMSLIDTTSNDSIREARRTYFGEMMLEAQDTLIARSFNGDSFWFSMRYELLRDKAEILRAINRRTEAIAILDAAIIDTTLSNLKKSHATTWRCFIKQEQDVIDSVITIEDIDFALCLPEDSLEIYSPYTFIESDTSFSLCHPDSLSGENLTMQYFVADTTLPYLMYAEMPDTIFTVAPHQYILPVGNFTLIAIDTTSKVYNITNIHVGTNTDCHPPDTIFQTSDTTLYFCDDGIKSFDSLYVWYPIETHLTYEVYNASNMLVNEYMPYLYQLTAGTFTIITFDSSTFIKHTANVEIAGNEIDYDYFNDTLSYYCFLDYYEFYAPDTNTKVYDELNELVLETSPLYYQLDGVNHQYKTIYTNLAICESHETNLIFDDVFYYPSETTSWIYGNFNSETDTCAFVKTEDILCLGEPINLNQEIEVLNIGGEHLLTTTIINHSTRGNGFYFCPPHWNNDPEHIYDWYSLVFRTNFCEYCRLDFRYDSIGAFDRQSNNGSFTVFKNRVMLYPNPANQNVNIRIFGASEIGMQSVLIQILDQTGRILEDKIHTLNQDGSIKLSMEAYAHGVYFVKIPALKYDGKVVLIKH
jgi:hypothetical protein